MVNISKTLRMCRQFYMPQIIFEYKEAQWSFAKLEYFRRNITPHPYDVVSEMS